MLTPTSKPLTSFTDMLRPAHGYFLTNAQLEISNPTTAIFKATPNGPKNAPVWARAWLSTEAGTLAETASPELKAGETVTLTVVLRKTEIPQFAYLRIESAPLKTEHVLALKLK